MRGKITKNPFQILSDVFECDEEDLVFSIECDPDLNKIIKAMQVYSDQNTQVLIDLHKDIKKL